MFIAGVAAGIATVTLNRPPVNGINDGRVAGNAEGNNSGTADFTD